MSREKQEGSSDTSDKGETKEEEKKGGRVESQRQTERPLEQLRPQLDALQMMDPDLEYNALSALFQSVSQDLKASYPAWENVCQKGLKLSAHLKATVVCLTSFVDALQAVSDHANNLKGASRDVGACVTRVCMRQRALEGRIRGVADALSDELAVTLQHRVSFWKQRTAELDRLQSKQAKKSRGRKGRADAATVAEQRQICAQMLSEQRQQMCFFVNCLMPVLNAEMSVLDEGPHIRQVVDSLDSTVKHVDSESLVRTILTDVSGGADNAWRQCLASASRSYRTSEEGLSLTSRATTPASTYSNEDNDITPQSGPRHPGKTYSNGRVMDAYSTIMPQKPPLQRRTSERSIGQVSSTGYKMSPPTPPLDVSRLSFRSSQLDLPDSSGRLQRPQSFQGELRTNHQSPPLATPLYQTSSSCSSSEAPSSAALIHETLQQIDQLGSDLENYCTTDDRHMTPNANGGTLTMNGTTNSLRRMHSSSEVQYQGVRLRSESSRPPPPQRRTSQITAATPTAPSVAEARANLGSIMGSRQSLNSTALYGGSSLGSNPDLRYSNINPYASIRHTTNHFKI